LGLWTGLILKNRIWGVEWTYFKEIEFGAVDWTYAYFKKIEFGDV
jgi:hypothetical protein